MQGIRAVRSAKTPDTVRLGDLFSILADQTTEGYEWMKKYLPESFAARGSCVDTMDPDLWFPHYGTDEVKDVPRKVCQGCPRKAACLIDGIQHGTGIWGGFTVKDRRRLHNQRKAAATALTIGGVDPTTVPELIERGEKLLP